MDTLPGDKKDSKVMQSTISRFACRILVERDSHKARIYAAGFDSSRNIFLGVRITFFRGIVCIYARNVGGVGEWKCHYAINWDVHIKLLLSFRPHRHDMHNCAHIHGYCSLSFSLEMKNKIWKICIIEIEREP